MGLDLGKPIGPLPLGAWVAVIGVGLGVSLYTRKQSPPPVVVEDTGGMPGVGTGAVGGWQYQPAPAAENTNREPETNEEWGRAAVNYLIAQGYDAAVADLGIRKYLAAENLSVQEYALVRLALQRFGSPPVPLPPGDIAIPTVPRPPTNVPGPVAAPPPPPPPPAAPPPPVRRTFTVTRIHNSLWDISRHMYGTGVKWPIIYAANRALIGPNPSFLRVGMVLTIP